MGDELSALNLSLAADPDPPPPRSLLDLPHHVLELVVSLAMSHMQYGRRASHAATRRSLRLSCRAFNQMILAKCTKIAWDGSAKEASEAPALIPSQVLAKCPLVTKLDMKGLRKPPSNLWGLPATMEAFSCWGSCPPGKQNRAFPSLDLSALAPLTRLKLLDLSHSAHRVTDLSALSACRALKCLNVGHCGIKDLQPLASCKDLEELNCSRTKITDLSPLAACGQLADLDCSKTKVADLSPLAACQMLGLVNCTSTLVMDLSPLARCAQLRSVTCSSSVNGLSCEYHRCGPDYDSDDEYKSYCHAALKGIEINVERDESPWY